MLDIVLLHTTELEMYFVNDTPTVNVSLVHAEFRSNRPGVRLDIQCHMTHFDYYKENCMCTITKAIIVNR